MPQLKLLDAQSAMNFVQSNTSFIERTANEIVYPELDYAFLVPVDTSAPEWVKSVTYYSHDKYGKAGWINGNADDVPRAGTDRTQFQTAVHTAGIGYGYGLEEISQARWLGVPLEAEDASAARRAYEEMVYRVAIFGDAEKGFQGLVNNSQVTVSAATTGNWATATPAQILADVNNALGLQMAGTLYTIMADTLLLPYSKWLAISSRMVGTDGSSVSILNWLLQNNAYKTATGRDLAIRGLRGLDTAGAGGTARMVAYQRRPEVVKLHIPMPHQFLPVFQASALRFEVPGIFRLGGTDVRQPKAFSYVDGL